MPYATEQFAPSTRGAASLRPLYSLALGAFAVGTEGFMIAAILPDIAKDLSASVADAGQLVTTFALAYAISSPVLTALTGRVERRTLLIFSMGFFAIANIVAALAPSYWALAAARVLLAFSAGLYVPGANALAGAMVPPEKRGRALAIVNAGITVAIALGVPLGAVIGNSVGWRMTFVGVAALSVLSVIGLVKGLPLGIGVGVTVATLSERLAVARRPIVLVSLLVTTLWAIGAYTVYTYIAPFMTAIIGADDRHVGSILFLWGAAAAIGLILGGIGTDRFGSRRVAIIALVLTATAMAGMSTSTLFLTKAQALPPVLAAVTVWGASHWGFWPAQQSLLIAIVGAKAASITLSLNASFMYLGFSLGALVGSVILTHASVADLGWVGSAFVLAALGLLSIITSMSKTG